MFLKSVKAISPNHPHVIRGVDYAGIFIMPTRLGIDSGIDLPMVAFRIAKDNNCFAFLSDGESLINQENASKRDYKAGEGIYILNYAKDLEYVNFKDSLEGAIKRYNDEGTRYLEGTAKLKKN